MAKAIALKLLGETAINVQSAGMEVPYGMGATIEAKQVIQERGGDLSNHYSQSIDKIDLGDFDMIVALTPDIANQLLRKHYMCPHRLRVLYIADPYGRGIEAYRRCATELEKNLYELF